MSKKKTNLKKSIFRGKLHRKKSPLRIKTSLSISQDYFIFAMGIILIALFSSIWYVWKEKNLQNENIEQQLAVEAKLIDLEISNYLNYVAYIAEDRGQKIAVRGATDIENINYLIQNAFVFPKTGEGLKKKIFRWPNFSWVDKDNRLIVTHNKGVITPPSAIDVFGANNEYISMSSQNPWQLQLSKPEYDPSSDQLMIKAAMGVMGIGGEYIGSIITYFEVDKMVRKIEQSIDDKVSFVILSPDMGFVMQSGNNIISKNHPLMKSLRVSGRLEDSGVFQKAFEELKQIKVQVDGSKVFSNRVEYGNNIYVVRRESKNYPFIILTGYNPAFSSNKFWWETGKRIGVAMVTTILLLVIMFIFYKRVVGPIKHLASVAKKIGQGEDNVEIRESKDRAYSMEMQALRAGMVMTKRHMKRVKDTSQALKTSNKSLEERTEELIKVTEQLEYQQKVADKSKDEKEKFLGRVRHAVNKPLNTALGYAQQLLRREIGELPLSQDDAVDYITNILDSIAQTLTYTTSEIVLTHVNVEDLIKSCVDILANDARKRKVSIKVAIQKNIPNIYISEIKVKQLLASLIFRGIEDTKGKGNIRVAAKVEKVDKGSKGLVITIADDGYGFTEEERQEMRDKYAKDKPKQDEDIRLTMPAMQRLVNLHHGALSINSEWNKGTISTLTLPYRDEKEADKSPELKAESVTYIDFKNKKKLDD